MYPIYLITFEAPFHSVKNFHPTSTFISLERTESNLVTYGGEETQYFSHTITFCIYAVEMWEIRRLCHDMQPCFSSITLLNLRSLSSTWKMSVLKS